MTADWFDDPADIESEDDYSLKEYDITASPNDFNIKTIFDFMVSGNVIVPEFQRNYVWDIKRASRLIESIIIGIPIPQIFLFEEQKNSFLVIDGQQRLMSIYYFMKKRFPDKAKRVELRRIFDDNGSIPEAILYDDNYFSDFNLRLTEQLPNKLNKLNYSTLGDFKTTFEMRTIRNIIIKQNLPTDDDSSIYEIFNRLNSGGVNLGPQEIRSSLYESLFYKMLYKINADARWHNLTGLTDSDLHMKDIEFLLRGFSLLLRSDRYKPSMTRFLNDSSKQFKNLSEEKVTYLELLFDSFLESCSGLPLKAFYGKTGKFTISIYDAVFAATCKRPLGAGKLVEMKIDPVQLSALKDDAEFVEASQSRTAGKDNVAKRLAKAAERLIV